jgi:hypothetical protein
MISGCREKLSGQVRRARYRHARVSTHDIRRSQIPQRRGIWASSRHILYSKTTSDETDDHALQSQKQNRSRPSPDRFRWYHAHCRMRTSGMACEGGGGLVSIISWISSTTSRQKIWVWGTRMTRMLHSGVFSRLTPASCIDRLTSSALHRSNELIWRVLTSSSIF